MTRRAAIERLRPRTLRAQLVVTVAGLLALALLLAAVVSVVLVHRALLERLDSQLRSAGTRFAVALEHNDNDGDADDQFGAVAGQAAGTLGARVMDGKVASAAIVAPHDSTGQVTSADRAALAQLRAPSGPRPIHFPHLGSYRIMVIAGQHGDLLVTGLPYEPVQDTTDDLILADAVVFAAVMAAVTLVSAALVGVTLRPLRRVTDTAAAVAVMPMATGNVSLPERVPAGARGTEVETLSAAFNAMLEQVEAALRSRHEGEEKLRTFIADASHELRTPVTVVRSHAELAQRSGGAELPEQVRHSLARIVDQAERMGRTVEELLLLARLDAGRPLDRDDVDLSRVVLDAVDDARITAPNHRWLLRLPEDEVHVQGDPAALHQVVTNLLTNARVHTPARTSVTTSLQVDRDRSLVHLLVGDDGPGIPPEVADRAFDRFVRADPARSGGGTGLGLPIVAALVNAQHGSVALEPGRGTRVRVTLPLAGSLEA